MAKLVKIFLVLFVFGMFGCGTQDGSDSDSPNTGNDPGSGGTEVSAIILTTNTSTINTGGSATLTVQLLDSSGQVVTDSKTVVFSFSSGSTLASVVSPRATSSGLVTTTLTARSNEGDVTVVASVDDASAEITIQISDDLAADNITLTPNPSSITVGGTSVVNALVTDTNGDPLEDGTNVNFSIDNEELGDIVASASVSGGEGIAQATFEAGTLNSGTVTVTGTVGSVSGTTEIEIVSAEAGSIEFVSANPQVIVIKGSGGTETSLIQFLVNDGNGNPVSGSKAVQLSLSGPNGGEYIGPDPGISSLEVGTINGIASVRLHSGTIPGTATVTATVKDDPSLTTSSGVIAIGGGVPSEGHFSLSTSQFNLEGLKYDGVTATISARIADRYGNYNVLEGTSVSFYSECGAIDRAVSLDGEGEGSVTFRTQQPHPEPVSFPGNLSVDLMDYENDLNSYYQNYLGVTFNNGNNPRDGLCTIVAVVDGEEEFTDSNANGIYDLGESFDDTYDDVHLDMDDDPTDIASSSIVAGFPYDSSFEDLIVDREKNAVFDGMNGVWDSNKRILQQLKLLFTGIPTISVADSSGIPVSSTINVANGGSEQIFFSVHDTNFNPPIGGTSINVTSTVGTLIGTTTHTFLDTNIIGAPVFSVTVVDPTADETEGPTLGTLTFSWNWKGAEYNYSIAVSVD